MIDVAARIGGEEFCILLINSSKEDTFEIAARILKAVQVHSFVIGDKETINITVSIGVSIYPDMNPKLDTLKEEADAALYHAKHSGRNRVCHSASRE